VSLRHFGTSAEVSRPNCPGAEVSDFSSIWCRNVLRHFGTSAEMSRTMFLVPKCLVRVRSVLWPKCPVAEVSGNHTFLYLFTSFVAVMISAFFLKIWCNIYCLHGFDSRHLAIKWPSSNLQKFCGNFCGPANQPVPKH